jgi:hypothetical protein
MPSIKEMREVCQQRRPNAKGKMVWAGHWFNRLVTRWFSIYITWACVKLNLSANSVTFLMIVTGLIGFTLCIPHLLWVNIAGALLLLLSEFLDCVDGEVARWNKKSSLKGSYLDLVYHVLCNAPASCICGLHLYAIYGEDKYLILAFLAYAAAQIRMGLREEFFRISLQIAKPESKPQDLTDIIAPKQQKMLRTRLLRSAKWLIHMCVDEYIVRLATIAGIFLAYAGMQGPIAFLAWWFVVFGLLHNVGEIISKYYVMIPDVGHEKKV